MRKNIAIIQARMGSTRFPGKVLKDIAGKPALWHLVENIRHSKLLTNIILATTNHPADDALEAFAKENAIICFRGDENNVLQRFYDAAKSVDAAPSDFVLRITGDDIFMDPYIIDSMITFFESTYPQYKLISNSFKPGFPYGLYFEMFDFFSLEDAHTNAETAFHKEHVTPYIRDNEAKFPAIAIESRGVDFSDVYLSIDTEDDLERNRTLIAYFESKNMRHPYAFSDVVAAYRKLGLKKV